MKDPAVLFYFQDFLVGTEFMTDEETGKYIRILCHQADKGALSKLQLERICGGKIPDAIMEKLKQNGDGKYYQERMKIEKEKRVNYSESRRKNRVKKDNKICKTYDIHMENENENENINEDKKKKREELLKKREEKFRNDVYLFTNDPYSLVMLQKFCDYWTESNKSKTKMLWELKPTFEISKRLVTWARNDKEFNKIEKTAENITYKELVTKFNNGEVDVWDKYEQITPGDKRSLWKPKK